VAGYQLYVRRAGEPYGAPIDVGSPAPAADGTVAWDVEDLPPGVNHFFAVSAYAADSRESDISSELSLTEPDPCMFDGCAAPDACVFEPAADGTPCVSRDPCAQGAQCVAGTCGEGAGGEMAKPAFRLTRRGIDTSWTGSGLLAASEVADPTLYGATLDLTDAGGQVLYRADLAASDFESNRTGTAYTYGPSGDAAEPDHGVRKLKLRRKPGAWHVRVRARAAALGDAFLHDRLTWVLHVGDQCWRRMDLQCVTKRATSKCA
jgi:hypothetical protein